jgi:hypothetical protein
MTDPVPSKEKLPDWLRRWYALKGELRFREAADEIERLQALLQLETGALEAVCNDLDSARTVERLRTALHGIQSCSTCEACRGAATLALGGAAPEPRALPYDELEKRMRDAFRHGTTNNHQSMGYELQALRMALGYTGQNAVDPPASSPEPCDHSIVNQMETNGGQYVRRWCHKCGVTMPATQPEVSVDRAFELGWRIAAEWAGRDDLIADIGSPVYEQDKSKALSSAKPPPDAPDLAFGQVVTDGQIVSIYAGAEGAEFKLLRHSIHGMLCEVRRPWSMRGKFRPATYDEMCSACPHDWLIQPYCDICWPTKPCGDGQ